MTIDQHIVPLQIPYGLTPSESRLALRLATGESLRVAAAVLDISYETARTTLKRVFEKTRTHRQTELVMVILSGAVFATQTSATS